MRGNEEDKRNEGVEERGRERGRWIVNVRKMEGKGRQIKDTKSREEKEGK